MTATEDGACLLASIIADPGDDAIRLVFADWLEENGQTERAEFVRAQYHAASIRPDAGCSAVLKRPCDGTKHEWCLRCRSIRKAGLLLDDHQEWCSLPDDEDRVLLSACEATFSDPAPMIRMLFARGFVSLVRCPLAAWLEHGKAIARAHPLETVEVSDRTPLPYHNNGQGEWFGWFKGQHERHPSCSLPDDAWNLVAADPACEIHGCWADFLSSSMANDALSRALVILAHG